MASPGINRHIGSFVGKAAEITLYLPFTPRYIHFSVNNGGAAEFGVKTDEMSGNAYVSTSSGADTGVTISGSTVTIASGADINIDTITTYYMATE